jgi:dihydropteroate synthase
MFSKSSILDLKALSVMGIINTTPDSFSDGGHFLSHDKALEQARRLIDEGADILDIGGESTRPGAADVSVDEEISRTIPLIESIRAFSDIPISIDTSKAEVMRAASAAGVNMINDVWALRREGAMQAAVDSGLPVCLMHMQGSPDNMQQNPEYESVLKEVKRFLHDRLFAAQAAGIKKQNLIIDPGFGFGKTLDQNYQLLKALPEFVEMGYPLLVGLSRKSMVGLVLDKPVDERVYGSVSAAVISAMLGAHIIRVHDVTETRQALAIVQTLEQTAIEY